MTGLSSTEKWFKEFQEFMTAESMDPPRGLTESLLVKVRADLNPPAWKVFFKLGGIHTIVGSLTLLICPQFGLGPSLGLMKYLMKLGPHACMFGCGILFLGASALVASLVLRLEEIRVLRKTVLLQFALLGLASIGVFLCLGADVILDLGLVWILGSILGGIATLELGWLIRSGFRKVDSYGF
ncbi:MAG TPA: hypothetical protein VI895_03360 [Bdellovibrionota bacterium]|nr:hypothetical protein [Bdellovibrionota bacterium]